MSRSVEKRKPISVNKLNIKRYRRVFVGAHVLRVHYYMKFALFILMRTPFLRALINQQNARPKLARSNFDNNF